jgi:hypothetical protein
MNRRIASQDDGMQESYTSFINLRLEGMSPELRVEVFKQLKSGYGRDVYKDMVLRTMTRFPDSPIGNFAEKIENNVHPEIKERRESPVFDQDYFKQPRPAYPAEGR